jgi:hypothetical protein
MFLLKVFFFLFLTKLLQFKCLLKLFFFSLFLHYENTYVVEVKVEFKKNIHK